MRIRIISPTSVSDGTGHRYLSGQVADVDDALATAWIAAGHARRTSDRATKKRAATRRPPRTATPPAADDGDTVPPAADE